MLVGLAASDLRLLRPGDPNHRCGVRRLRPPRAARLRPAKPKGALSQASPALLAHEKYPTDALVQRTIAMALLGEQQGLESLRWLAKASATPWIIGLVRSSKAAIISRSTADTIDPTLQLLRRALAPSVSMCCMPCWSARSGAGQGAGQANLSKPTVRAAGSPPRRLRSTCAAPIRATKKGPAARRSVGDARLVPHLKSLQSTHNCGPLGLLDCFACLRGNDTLQTTIAARCKVARRTTPAWLLAAGKLLSVARKPRPGPGRRDRRLRPAPGSPRAQERRSAATAHRVAPADGPPARVAAITNLHTGCELGSARLAASPASEHRRPAPWHSSAALRPTCTRDGSARRCARHSAARHRSLRPHCRQVPDADRRYSDGCRRAANHRPFDRRRAHRELARPARLG